MNLSQAVKSLSEDKYIQTMYKKELGVLAKEIAVLEAKSLPVESIALKLKEALNLLEGEVVHSKSPRKQSA